MDTFAALRISALWSVWNSRKTRSKPDDEYELGRVHRWYARTFHCTIAEAESLPVDHVWQTYWLESFEELDDKGLDEQIESITEDPEVLEFRKRQEDEADADVYEISKEEQAKDAIQKIEEATEALKGLQVRQEPFKVGGGTGEASLVMDRSTRLASVPEDISISFMGDDEELDLEADTVSFGLLDTPKRKR